jgi:hypothetical protein
MTQQQRLEFATIAAGAVVIAFSLIALLAFDGCGAGATTCAVIDLAHTACDTLPIRYMAPDGTIKTEHVQVSELRAAAVQAAASRQVPDAGQL